MSLMMDRIAYSLIRENDKTSAVIEGWSPPIISPSITLQARANLCNNKAGGDDGAVNEVLKLIPVPVVHLISDLF